jgi:hypothetical protein
MMHSRIRIHFHVKSHRRLEEKCNLAKKAHNAAMAAERNARNELRGALAELNAARKHLKSSSSRIDTSLPQDDMNAGDPPLLVMTNFFNVIQPLLYSIFYTQKSQFSNTSTLSSH